MRRRRMLPLMIALSVISASTGCGSSTEGVATPTDVDVGNSATGEGSAEPDTSPPSTHSARHVAEAPPAEPSGGFVDENEPISKEASLRARQLFKQGVEAFEQGDYATAATCFRAAHLAAPKPEILYNVGQAELKMGNVSGACDTFEEYWNTTPPARRRFTKQQLASGQCPNIAALP